jgi:3-oxoisoapionate decarboxylase
MLREYEAQEVTLAVENYEVQSCGLLTSLVRRLESEHVGICLDTTNSLGALETPRQVVELLGSSLGMFTSKTSSLIELRT